MRARAIFWLACLTATTVLQATATKQVGAEEPKFVFRDFTSVALKSSATEGSLQLVALPPTEFGAKLNVHVALNNAGNFLATGSSDGNVLIWALDTAGDKPWQKLTAITSTKSSPSAHLPGPVLVDLHPKFPSVLALGSIGIDQKNSEHPSMVRVIWTLSEATAQRFHESGNAIVGTETLKGDAKSFFGFAISPDANYEAQFDEIKLWTTSKVTREGLNKEEREKLRRPFRQDTYKVIAMTWCGTALTILTNEQILAWTQTPEVIGNPSFLFSSKGAKGLAGSACGTYLLAFGQGEEQKGASLYHRRNKWVATLDKVHNEPVVAACFSPEKEAAKIMISAAKNGLKIWDVASGSLLNEVVLNEEIISLDCGLYAEGKYIVVAGTSTGKFHSYRLEKKQ